MNTRNTQLYTRLNQRAFKHQKLDKVTVHGRFQPPLHINHWNYIFPAFEIAKKVIVLITNPDLDETDVEETNHRNKKESNPFTYGQRVKIFKSFFEKTGIVKSRYQFRPFNITSEKSWAKVLDKDVPNLVNTYGPGSRAKLKKFQDLGYQVIHSSKNKAIDISGTKIRKILNLPLSPQQKKAKLIAAGFMPEATEGLFRVL